MRSSRNHEAAERGQGSENRGWDAIGDAHAVLERYDAWQTSTHAGGGQRCGD